MQNQFQNTAAKRRTLSDVDFMTTRLLKSHPGKFRVVAHHFYADDPSSWRLYFLEPERKYDRETINRGNYWEVCGCRVQKNLTFEEALGTLRQIEK